MQKGRAGEAALLAGDDGAEEPVTSVNGGAAEAEDQRRPRGGGIRREGAYRLFAAAAR